MTLLYIYIIYIVCIYNYLLIYKYMYYIDILYVYVYDINLYIYIFMYIIKFMCQRITCCSYRIVRIFHIVHIIFPFEDASAAPLAFVAVAARWQQL